MDIEPVDPAPARAFPWAILRQRWEDLTFVHWAVAPELVAPLLPAGTRPDTFDGAAHVGLVGFRMVGLGLGRGPGVPYFGTFRETNVRLYSVDDAGRRAVVFRSLDASRLVPVLVARASLRLPYLWSTMRLDRDGDTYTYRCRRRWPGPAGASSRMTVRVGDPIADPTPLEHFLTARWGLHTRAYGRTLHLPNWHPRWPLHRAELLHLDDELVAAAGLPAPAGAPVSVLCSPGVPVVFGLPAAARRPG
ncbi:MULTISPECIES: YqjF family protein [unclassified Micromonospora]|uniref:YqjF family protein n=1 Tax=unclassified Micromonospora TaxID=2617518 RepID=UPI003632E4CD